MTVELILGGLVAVGLLGYLAYYYSRSLSVWVRRFQRERRARC